MNKVNKKLLFRTTICLPFVFFGYTLFTTATTWWHGDAIYFVYSVLLINFIGIPFVFSNYKNFYLLYAAVMIIALSFNIFGFILLFFPNLNNNTLIFMLLPSPFNYAIPSLCLGIFTFFSVKKSLEIDYEKMKKKAFKSGIVDKLDGICFLNEIMGSIATLEFKTLHTSKYEKLISGGILAILFITLGPFKALGSTMSHNGNTPFNALFFMIGGYFMIWICYLFVLGNFAQYQLIKKVEQDLGKELKPGLKTT